MNSNERCANCRHWDTGERRTSGGAPLDLRWGEHEPGQRLGLCLLASGSLGQHIAPLALAVDGANEVRGELITDARFGCVLFA